MFVGDKLGRRDTESEGEITTGESRTRENGL